MEAVGTMQGGWEWGVAMLPMTGQVKSGDTYLVETFAGGALAAVIDGLGHGEEAAEAARIAYDTILQRPFDSDPQTTPRHENVIPRRGVVGSHLPTLHATVFAVNKGDTLVLVTDGIRRGFESSIRMDQAPQEIADAILTQHAPGTDDALVLVLRCTNSDGNV